MTTYIAFLRGIMPTNPNMRNEKLRVVFESLGFSNVQSVISSGNIIFESASKDAGDLENKIEKSLFKQLGIKSPAYIRSKEQIEALIKKNPFKNAEHNSKSYLIVSFLKKAPWEVCTTLDMSGPKTPAFMAALDKKYNKEITTRTWKTVERIRVKMQG
ncbi:MAG TPA: DUF1697 domain-containing protein [Candidatus Paceibacterota bacterium]|jgi:uncharacterized protein (DUF1697 family)|nr:DUF1697 domain-containing protein [Candidatus Paceibacterota bacterium]